MFLAKAPRGMSLARALFTTTSICRHLSRDARLCSIMCRCDWEIRSKTSGTSAQNMQHKERDQICLRPLVALSLLMCMCKATGLPIQLSPSSHPCTYPLPQHPHTPLLKQTLIHTYNMHAQCTHIHTHSHSNMHLELDTHATHTHKHKHTYT